MFGVSRSTDTLNQTEEERMAEEAMSVVKAYVKAGVFTFGESWLTLSGILVAKCQSSASSVCNGMAGRKTGWRYSDSSGRQKEFGWNDSASQADPTFACGGWNH